MMTRGPKIHLTKVHRLREHTNSDARRLTEARHHTSDIVRVLQRSPSDVPHLTGTVILTHANIR